MNILEHINDLILDCYIREDYLGIEQLTELKEQHEAIQNFQYSG